MGLNMNYTLLMEGANKQFELPEYKSVYVYPCYEQSYILECINDMRRDMINNNYELLFIFENVESLNEGEIIDAIFGTIAKIFMAVINAIKAICSAIVNAIKRFINYIKSKFRSRPKEVVKLSPAVYLDTLNAAIQKNSPTINIPDINPTDALVDRNYPPTTLECIKHMDYPMRELSNIISRMRSHTIDDVKLDLADTMQIEEDLANVRKDAAKELFGDRLAGKIVIDELTASVSGLAGKHLFGNNEVKTVPLTVGLYQAARTNLNANDDILDYMDKLEDKINSGYNRIINDTSSLLGLIERTNVTVVKKGPYAKQSKMLQKITIIANKCANTISDIVSAHSMLAHYKISRLAQLYGPTSGSAKVLEYCDTLVLAEIKETEGNIKNESTIGVDPIEATMSEMNYQIELARGALIDASFVEDFNNYIVQEASVQGVKNNIGNFVDNIVTAVSNAFKSFSSKVEEVVAKQNKAWWDRNKDRLTKMDVSKVTVNQWYNYSTDKFRKSSYVQWDENSDDFNSDENMQKAIFNKIGGTPTTDDGASFTEKVKSLYYDKYINTNTGEGTPFGNIGLKPQDMITFIEDFMSGNNGGILKAIRQELDDINRDARDVKNKYKDQEASGNNNQQNNNQQNNQQQAQTAQTKTTTTTNANGTSTSTKTQQSAQNASAIDDNMTYLGYLREASNLSSKQRNNLPDSAFGLPKQRRYPMPDEKHVLLAIRFFNHVEPENEKELAKNIIKKIKEFDMADRVKVGDGNRFKPYWEKSGLSKTPKKLTEAEELFSFDLAGALGLYNEQTITGLEEADVKVPQDTVEKNSGNASGNNAIRAKITRCFKYNSQATGAKMTQAFAAFRQYINFYKSVANSIDSGKGNDKEAKEQQQNKKDNK